MQRPRWGTTLRMIAPLTRVIFPVRLIAWWLSLASMIGAIAVGIVWPITLVRFVSLNTAPIRFMEALLLVGCIALGVIVLPNLVYTRAPNLALPTLLLSISAFMIIFAVGANVILDLVLLLAMIVFWYELGWLTTGSLRPQLKHPLEGFVICVALGSGIAGLAAVGLAAAGWLTQSTVLGAVALVYLNAVRRWVGTLSGRAWRPPQPGRLTLLLLGLTALFLLLGYARGVTPEVDSDAVRVHLPLAQALAGLRKTNPTTITHMAAWPIHGQALYAAGIALHGPILAKLIHTAVGVLAVVSVGLVGLRYGGRTVGLLAAALIASPPLMVWEAGTAYLDLFPMLYAAIGCLALLGWQDDGAPSWLLLLGAALGFGVASKLTFGFMAIAFVIVVAVFGRPDLGGRGRLRALALILLGGLLAGGPWVIRAVILSGQLPGLSLFQDAVSRGTGQSPPAMSDLPSFGIGRNPINLLRLPWELTVNSDQFGQNPKLQLGIAPLILLPSLFFLRANRATLSLSTLILVPVLVWFYTAQYLRYLLPVLIPLTPLLCQGLIQARGINDIVAKGRQKLMGRIQILGISAMMLVSVTVHLGSLFSYLHEFPVRLILGREDSITYLRRVMPSYQVLEQLDRVASPNSLVLAAPEGQQLYTHALLIGAPWISPSTTPTDFLLHLRSKGIMHVVIDREHHPETWHPSWTRYLVADSSQLDKHLEIVYSIRDVTLYRLPDVDP